VSYILDHLGDRCADLSKRNEPTLARFAQFCFTPCSGRKGRDCGPLHHRFTRSFGRLFRRHSLATAHTPGFSRSLVPGLWPHGLRVCHVHANGVPLARRISPVHQSIYSALPYSYRVAKSSPGPTPNQLLLTPCKCMWRLSGSSRPVIEGRGSSERYPLGIVHSVQLCRVRHRVGDNGFDIPP